MRYDVGPGDCASGDKGQGERSSWGECVPAAYERAPYHRA
eukprot:CAMPEP_0116926608 /NCGR_PEP_ID=MMETSP0467-20121206/24826_1 /TAXON_ID=283647 /ORGANISM="Mesodinium pulex, Strain SPMC105" /LENGTH=39 /DNA_ID= /DNA_START= /DNA_END= /DNA_ORIENTATION=